MGRDFQRVLGFGGQQDQVKLVSLSVVLNCGNIDSVCPHLSSDAGHSQARSAQHLRGFGIASRKPDGQSSAEGARGDCSTQRADAYYQHLHCESSKMPAMRLKATSCLKNRALSPLLPATVVIFVYFGGVTYWASPLPKDQFSFGASTKLMRTSSLRIFTPSWRWSASYRVLCRSVASTQ